MHQTRFPMVFVSCESIIETLDNGAFLFHSNIIFNEVGHFNAKLLSNVRSGSNNVSFGVRIIEYGVVFIEKMGC